MQTNKKQLSGFFLGNVQIVRVPMDVSPLFGVKPPPMREMGAVSNHSRNRFSRSVILYNVLKSVVNVSKGIVLTRIWETASNTEDRIITNW